MIQGLLNKLTFKAIALPERVTQGAISLEAVEKVLALSPRRICFNSTHGDALRHQPGKNAMGKSWVGRFALPFRESAYPIFHKDTEIDLYSKYGNWFRSVQSQDEFDRIAEWVEKHKQFVFIRDTLALSLALSEHMLPGLEGRTQVGELERQAKYNQSPQAVERLIELLTDAINETSYYCDADVIAAIPPRPDKDFDLPTTLVAGVASQTDIENISGQMKWQGPKESLKNVALKDKWQKLEDAQLQVTTQLEGKKVILVDDLYQSGITMQYVARALLSQGAGAVYGLTVVKSMRDTDNV